ncbi:MAG: hypothetical protein INQ03_00445 [Candidatus Heimdallarchaeota archaeon]|nr:hypothetical protein [Candidatus Heimdallarchaeota archaeon]
MDETVEYIIDLKKRLIDRELDNNEEYQVISSIFGLEKNLSKKQRREIENEVNNYYQSQKNKTADKFLENKKSKRKYILDEITDTDKQIEQIKEERDRLNELTKDAFEESKFFKEERDVFNKKIREHKEIRDNLQKNCRANMRRIQELEIKLQTTGNLTSWQERDIIEEIQQINPDFHHNLVIEYSEYSQKKHEEYVEAIKRGKELKDKTNKLHQKFLELKEKRHKTGDKLFKI